DKDNPKFSSKNGILYNKKKTVLVRCPYARKNVTIPKSVRTIQANAFFSVQLRKIIIPDTVKTIERAAFSGCTKLKSIKLSKNLQVLHDRTFEECLNLKTIKIPDSVEKIEELAFFLCRNLQSVEIGENLKDIDEEVFMGCKKLKKITVKTEKLKYFPFPTTRDIGKKKNVLIIAKKDSYVYRIAKKKGFKVRAF
ncbi:MAG: leucine-rich repeat domain-containing protein, partial [Lachnospiraceae bacterium]|nr:leucine-rich repeat domain-containing protein [Lachnospiraceae bacterium]